jgi:hypothetical protein
VTAPVSPRGIPVDIDSARDLTVRDATRLLYPGYGPALRRLPRGRQVFRGLPFDLGSSSGRRRWVLVDAPTRIPLEGAGQASHVIVAHLCDTWRGDDGARPAGLAVGHVVPVGEELARYSIRDRRGRTWDRLVRRRFEVNDGLLGWGSAAFAAVRHRDNEVADWRGPHPVQTPGRYAPAGQSGTLTIMPGTYGANQTGMTDDVPSPGSEAFLWLHTIELEPAAEPIELIVEPLAGGRPGSSVLLAAVTLYQGSDDPLRRSARFSIATDGRSGPLEVDLGTIIRSRDATSTPSVGLDAIVGWGSPRGGGDDQADRRRGTGPGPRRRIIDLSIAADAIVRLGGREIPGRSILDGSVPEDPDGGPSIEILPAPNVPVEVELISGATGARLPGRVRFTAADGRYLPPVGHRDEVNPGFFEDTGADLVLGASTYAYVPGSFSIDLPVGLVDVEAMVGFEHAPVRLSVEIDPSTRRLELPIERAFERPAGRWMTADSHVHFIAPSTALLQAAAEDVDLVNLLAAQWGDLYTNVTDLTWGSTSDPSGQRRVVVGTENRQNVLGHLALLGAHRMTRPLASGGPPEGRMAGALDTLLADWADRCRAAGGLVIAAHFPLPYAEIAADIASGRIDGVEAQALAPGLDDPMILEWYRFLDLGYRLPIVAGTDKMSAEVPVGAVRTYAHLRDDDEASFDGWASAVRAGRTSVSSGPVIELAVEGHEPGAVVRLRAGGRLAVTARARAAQPVITELEVVVNGRIVAETSATGGSTDLTLHDTIDIAAGAWIAARSRSRFEIQSAFTTSMAAHTSPVYVEVEGRPLVPSNDDIRVVEQVMLGTRAWIAELAAVTDPTERARMVGFLDDSLERFRRRVGTSRS